MDSIDNVDIMLNPSSPLADIIGLEVRAGPSGEQLRVQARPRGEHQLDAGLRPADGVGRPGVLPHCALEAQRVCVPIPRTRVPQYRQLSVENITITNHLASI